MSQPPPESHLADNQWRVAVGLSDFLEKRALEEPNVESCFFILGNLRVDQSEGPALLSVRVVVLLLSLER